jgi:spermidine/putrescine transport system substrate-binding protein
VKRLFTLLAAFAIGAVLPFLGHIPLASSADGNVLSIYNWSTYIDPEIVSAFEKEFGAEVKYDTYENNEELFAKLQAGNPGYDIIVPSDYMVEAMIAENMLEKLTLDNIPNAKNVDPKFANPPYDPGNVFTMPYQWGTVGIGYNVKETGGEIESWANLFEPKFKGRVALLDAMRETIGFALISLGYDLNTTNPDEIAEARDYLIDRSASVVAFAPDTGQALLDQGEVDLVQEYSGDIFQVMEENPDLRYIVPKEGTNIWTDNLAIPKGAKNKELAEQFINFILRPEMGAKLSNFIRYGSPNKKAIDTGLIAKEDLGNPGIYPPPEVFEKLKYIKDVGEATTLYDDAWTELKLSLGL